MYLTSNLFPFLIAQVIYDDISAHSEKCVDNLNLIAFVQFHVVF